jgi:RimJ/RimL family protein N-acetyltransferase
MAKDGREQDRLDHTRRRYPKHLKLAGRIAVTLRLMEPNDKPAILAFTRALPPDDLLFLRTDITENAVVDEWTQNIERGVTVTIVADVDGDIIGYASLHHDQAHWTRRVGEIRVLLGARYRGVGLGRRMAQEIFQIGQARGIKKMAALMTPDQTSARAAFEHLGFQVEALLQDWVIDRNGRPRDVLIMSHDVEGLTDRVSA